MEGKAYVLAHKTERHLLVRLTFSKKGRKPQWEYTEEIDLATGFLTFHEAEEKQRQHNCPPRCAMPRDYIDAHRDYSRAKEFQPHNGKQTHFGF